MVGDNPSDSISAHAAGVGGVIAVRTGKIVEDLLKEAKPHLILNTVGDIPESLREHE
jgi:phosphoglycolate phosphatase-like HAD superfamily hydrolase